MTRWATVLTAIALIGMWAAPAAGQTLSPAQTPLPGSNFQGGDGDQATADSYDDWASLDAGQLVHGPDDNAQDSSFVHGHELVPDEWELGVSAGGVTPPATNILDKWSAIDEAGASTFLYLAFARYAGGGTSFLTFELNRDARLWRNAAGSQIPCRIDGDLLITFEPHGNDADVTVTVRRWVTAAGGSDPGSGCARRGTLTPAGTLSTDDVQGAANNVPITNELPSAFYGAGAEIDARRFGEMAVDASALFDQLLGSTCGAFGSVWMHSRSSDSPQAALKDYVAPEPIDLRRCSAAGTKWHDLNADGVRQGGEGGLEGWRIYADLNENGRFDDGEPFAITDGNGDYVIDDIRVTGAYTLREEPTPAVPSGPWTCSSPAPCSHTVDPAAEPFARDNDFGNWRPARVTLVKNVDPPRDPGRFDLSVGGFTLEGAGHNDSETFALRPPGPYTVSEAAAEGTNGDDYISSVACTGAYQPRGRRVRATAMRITVVSGEEVKCTFVNARGPSITVDKDPPSPTMTGDPLVYLLHVTNTGSVPFPAESVEVRDSQCDDPVVVEQLGPDGAPDATIATLDPGDQWTYRCEVPTSLPADPDDCEPGTRDNRATVTAPDAGDSDDASAALVCPPQRRREVQIVKVGPPTAVAGTPLTYRLYVRNTGEAPFPEADVQVSDPDCDAPPVVVARYADAAASADQSPTVLNPGDVWIYECTRTTATPGADCQPFTLPNTSSVLVQTPNRPVAEDDDTYQTPLTCPPGPPVPPQPPEPPVTGPSGERPEVPDVPDPPEAGTAGRASLSRLPRCLRRGSRVTIRGARIAGVRVTLRGRRLGGLRIRALQRRAVIRLRREFRPGRYRVTARVRFHRGASTPTLRLTRTVRICAPRRSQTQPRFTG